GFGAHACAVHGDDHATHGSTHPQEAHAGGSHYHPSPPASGDGTDEDSAPADESGCCTCTGDCAVGGAPALIPPHGDGLPAAAFGAEPAPPVRTPVLAGGF